MLLQLKYFESWKVYQASSLGDVNRKTGKRGNHPFIYLEPHPTDPTKSYGIMLTTKNARHAVLKLDNILGNNEIQNILIANIGYIDNNDIGNVWIFPKTNCHATINIEIKIKVIQECNLKISSKSIKYKNKAKKINDHLLNQQEQINNLINKIKKLEAENIKLNKLNNLDIIEF